MNWHSRYHRMKSGLKLSNSDIAEITGNTSNSVKCVTQSNRELPRWTKLSIVIFEKYNPIKKV